MDLVPFRADFAEHFYFVPAENKVDKEVKSAKGWIIADSRYQLFVNGQRIQWGPAPCDPRWQEADPADITGFLKSGIIIGCQVLYYGAGDGTSPIGIPVY